MGHSPQSAWHGQFIATSLPLPSRLCQLTATRLCQGRQWGDGRSQVFPIFTSPTAATSVPGFEQKKMGTALALAVRVNGREATAARGFPFSHPLRPPCQAWSHHSGCQSVSGSEPLLMPMHQARSPPWQRQKKRFENGKPLAAAASPTCTALCSPTHPVLPPAGHGKLSPWQVGCVELSCGDLVAVSWQGDLSVVR